MKNFKVVLSWVVIINAIIVFNQPLFSRDLSEIINKTTLNHNVNEEVNELTQWKNREFALYKETGDEQNQLQGQFLNYFIERNKIENPNEKEFKHLLSILLDVQRRSKGKFEALYIASTFHIAEMSFPYAPKMSHKLLAIVLKKTDSNVSDKIICESNFLLGNYAQRAGHFNKAIELYYKCYEKASPDDAFLRAKTLCTIAMSELYLGKNRTAKSHIDLAISLLKEKGNLTEHENCVYNYIKSVNSIYLSKSGDTKAAINSLENNYSTKFISVNCLHRYVNVSSTILDLYISTGNKIGYTKVFNDLEKIVNSEIETKFKIQLLKIMHDNYEKIGRQDLSKIQFNRLNKLYAEQEKISTIVTENIIDLLIENEQKLEISNDKIASQNEMYFDLSALLIILLVVGFGFTLGYKKYYAKDIAARRAIVKINEFERKQEVSALIIEKLKEETTNLNLVLNMKTDSEKALIEKIKEYKKDNALNSEQMLLDLQMQLNNLIQIDLKNTSATKNTKGETDVFFDKIKSLHPELSSHDLNLCSYIRLKLNSKEISLITGITPGSVRVYKTKLKNKLGLKNEENLNQYLQTI